MFALKAKKKKHSSDTARDGRKGRADSGGHAASARAPGRRHAAPVVSLASVQSKVAVGPANDSYEREADATASRVVSGQPTAKITPLTPTTDGAVARAAEREDEAAQSKPIQRREDEPESVQSQRLQRRDDEQDESVQAAPVQRRVGEEQEDVQSKPVQRQSEDESETTQRQSEQDESVQAAPVQRPTDEEQEEVQSRPLQRQSDDENETAQRQGPDEEQETMAQSMSVQRQTAEASVQRRAASDRQRFESNLTADNSAGEPLPADTRSTMESRFGADFSGVRVHTDSKSADMNKDINARAFTYGSHIYFNRGEYSPQTPAGSHLLAHELTHTVQQGAAPSRSSKGASPANVQRVVQPWSWGGAIDSVVGGVTGAVEWVGDSLSKAIDYVKDKAADFVQEIPGYKLLTVIMARDPITGDSVARNGRNFIEAGLDVIPNGEKLQRKLEKEGALTEAADWLDKQIEKLDIDPAAIGEQLRKFWDGLEISDVGRVKEKLAELGAIFSGPISRLKRFAVTVGGKLLEIIKDYVTSAVVDFVRDQTNAYPLLTVILEKDPIKDEPVERTPMALLKGFMKLSESGREQLRQMEESGSLQRAADWIDRVVSRLNIAAESIVGAFKKAWQAVTIDALLDPPGLFRKLYDIFAAPVGRIVDFVVTVGKKVLEFIKDALISRLVNYARKIRGYPLLTVLLGKDPFSQDEVERSVPNIVRGFMSLMEGGEQQFREMQQTGAIARMTSRVENAVARLGFTWEYIRGLFSRTWERFSLEDLAAPIEAFKRLMNIFKKPLQRLIDFVGDIVRIVVEVVMEVMNFPIDLIRNIITRAMQAINDIKKDPIGFLKNLIRAVKTGFQQFFDNILTHLVDGLTGWLFSELEHAGITPPRDLSFKSILGFVLEVLGITVEKIWNKLAEKIGRKRVEKVRAMIDKLTGVWVFVKDVMTRGPVAIWEYLKDRLSNLWDTVLESVRSWVMTRIIQTVTAKIIGMLDPTGIMTVVNGFIAFYKAVQSFIRYLREMLEIVNSFVVGVAELARDNVSIAANALENALARAMPVAIGFLANQAGLSGVGRRIGEMVEKVRSKVDDGMTWLVDKAVNAGTAFLRSARSALGMGGGAAEAEPEDEGKGGDGDGADWRDERGEFTDDGAQHEVSFDGTNIKVASRTPHTLEALKRDDFSKEEAANYQAALDLQPVVRALTDEYARAEMSDDASAKKAKEREIGENLQKMAIHLRQANLFSGKPELPPTRVSFETESGKAKKVKADPLSKVPGNTRGSSTTGKHIAGAHFETEGAYDQVHLLSAALHGPAVYWNLAMGTRKANQGLSRGPEKRAYDEISGKIEKDSENETKADGKVLSYESEVMGYWSGPPDWKKQFATEFKVTITPWNLGKNNQWKKGSSEKVYGPYQSIEPTGSGVPVQVPIHPEPQTMSDVYALVDKLQRGKYTYEQISRALNRKPNIVEKNGRHFNANTLRREIKEWRDGK